MGITLHSKIRPCMFHSGASWHYLMALRDDGVCYVYLVTNTKIICSVNEMGNCYIKYQNNPLFLFGSQWKTSSRGNVFLNIFAKNYVPVTFHGSPSSSLQTHDCILEKSQSVKTACDSAIGKKNQSYAPIQNKKQFIICIRLITRKRTGTCVGRKHILFTILYYFYAKS